MDASRKLKKLLFPVFFTFSPSPPPPPLFVLLVLVRRPNWASLKSIITNIGMTIIAIVITTTITLRFSASLTSPPPRLEKK